MARAKIDTSTPHDGLFKKTFGVAPRASALFRAKLPGPLSARIDWETLERVPGSFVNPRLAPFYTDLLFSVRLGESELLLYLLLEHQSTVEKDMPFRMLDYMVEVWKSHRARHPGSKRLPVIIPVLVSHAEGGWNAPLSLAEMLDPDPASIPGLAALVPNFELVVEDLAHLSNDHLRALALDAVAKLAMVMLRDVRDDDARAANLEIWMQLCRDVLDAPNGREAMIMFLSYLAHVLEENQFRKFCDIMLRELPEAEPTMRTYAEVLIEQGLERGREAQLRVSIVDILEIRGFALTEEQRARIESCESLELLQRWYAAAKTAPADQRVDALLDEAAG